MSTILTNNSPVSSNLEDRYRAIFENSADAILILENGKFVECNLTAVDMMGYANKSTLLQCHPSELSPQYQSDGQNSQEKADKIMSEARVGKTQRFEWDHVKASGEPITVEVLLTAIQTSEGQVLQTVWRDISERKQLEKELRHSQKMDVVGKLAGGIAHDFNNLLVPILGYSDLLVEFLKDQPEYQELAIEIRRGSESASTLVNKLLTFSRKEGTRPVVLDMTKAVTELLGIIGKLVGENIKVSFNTPEELLPVRVGPGEIEQILLNLVSNARDALGKDGVVNINLSVVVRDQLQFAQLDVVDNGMGMDEETLNRLYEPFYTTKESGRGTGLGMSTVYNLIANADGHIEVESELGKGTSFRIFLPIVNESELHAEQNTSDEALLQDNNSHTIMVVEDNNQVSTFIQHVLTKGGYAAVVVGNGNDALESIKSKAPDMILSDVIMPEMSGPMLMTELVRLGIKVPMIFMSGYADDHLAANDLDIEHVTILRKPFTADALLKQISTTLSESSSATS